MKGCALFIVGLAIAMTLADVEAQEPSPNLLVNGGFEEVSEEGQAVGWRVWPDPLPEANCVGVDETVFHSGKRSMRITHENPGSYSRMDRRVTLKANGRYVITAWIKGDEIEPGPGGGICAKLYIGKEGDNAFTASRHFRGTFDWRSIEIGPFDLGDRTWLTFIPYLHQATGTVWYDDIAIREVTPAMRRREAQRRARRRLQADLDVVASAAQEAGAENLAEYCADLREWVATADDLPTTLDAKSGPPYFGSHEWAFQLMARVNQKAWADVDDVPGVHARWVEPFSDVSPLHGSQPGTGGEDWLVEMMGGEFEQACLRLTNLTETQQGVRLDVTPLASAEAGVLPAGQLTWRALRYVELEDGTMLGDPLPKIGAGSGPVSVALPPGMTQDIWLMIDSRGVPAGQYEGTVKVTAGEASGRELALSVVVHPIDFPEELPIHTFAYAYTTWELLAGRIEQSRADLVAHRINTYVIRPECVPRPEFDDAGQWQGLDWGKMDEQLAWHKGARFFLLWLGFEQVEHRNRLTPEGGAEYPADEWRPFLRRWLEELVDGLAERGLGYERWALYITDEPSGERARVVAGVGGLVREIDEEVRIFENPYGAATPADMELMAPVVDIWCPALGTAKGDRLEFCRETSDEVWTYQVLSKMAPPLRSHRLGFWECFVKDLRGHGFWNYADGGGSRWDAWDHERHDYAVVYDGDEEELIPSKRWEAYREGTEDFALLWMLAQEEDDETRGSARSLAEEVLEAADAMAVRKARSEILRRLTDG